MISLVDGSHLDGHSGSTFDAFLGSSGTYSHSQSSISCLSSNLYQREQLLNSSAILLQVQGTLILQPTTTSRQKLIGTRIHFTIQAISLLAFLTAFLVIEVNKGDHPRFISPHGVLGLITYILIFLQASVGVVQYFFPTRVLGSVDKGKKIYKYHRAFGYGLLILELGTVTAATQTTFNLAALHISVWGVVVTAVLVVAGVGARVKKSKLGF